MSFRYFETMVAAGTEKKKQKSTRAGQSAASVDHPLTLTQSAILKSRGDADLDFPAVFRMRDRGEEFRVGKGTATLKAMLLAARRCHKEEAATKEESSLWRSVAMWERWSQLAPSCLNLRGSYILPHVLRKHVMCFYMRHWGHESVPEFVSRLFILDRRRQDQPDITSVQHLLRISPDQRQNLSKIPPHYNLERLSRLLSCPPILLPCFACTWAEAVDKLPLECDACLADPAKLAAALEEYLEQHCTTPCPYVLVKLTASTQSSKSSHQA